MIINNLGDATWRRRFAVAAILALIALAAAALGSGSAPALAAAPLPSISYDLRVDLNMEGGYLTAVESVSYTNRTSDTLSSLVFNIPASYFGGFALADVTVDGEAVKVAVEKQSAEIALPKPLAPGTGALVVVHFRLDLPPGDGRYGIASGVVTLGDWYPMLAVYDGAWIRTPYQDIGDPFYTAVADYDVFLATSTPAVVVATGETMSNSGRYWHFRARQARDFALAASGRYALASKTADGITVTIAYLPEHAAAASQALEVAGGSLTWYRAQVGGYPFSTLSIAETTAQHYIHTAQEHSGLIFLRSDTVEGAGYYLDILAAHETAHQWFFGVVGNDQLRDPWLDEGLVNALALDYFRQRNPDEYKSMWDGWGNYTVTTRLNRAISDYQNGTSYFDGVYRRGATFLRELQNVMGPADYWQGLKTYYAENSFAEATPAGFLRTMRLATAADVLPLYRQYFDYPYLSRPDPVVTATVPSNVVSGLPLSVTLDAGGSGVRFRARLDSQTVEVQQNKVALAGALLTPGEHVLEVEAFGEGIGYARQTARFTAAVPPPTPTAVPTPTAAPTPRPVLVVVMAAAAPALTDRDVVWRFLAWLAVACLVAVVSVEWAGLGSAVRLLLLGSDEPEAQAAGEAIETPRGDTIGEGTAQTAAGARLEGSAPELAAPGEDAGDSLVLEEAVGPVEGQADEDS